jgi:hypothetical protein
MDAKHRKNLEWPNQVMIFLSCKRKKWNRIRTTSWYPFLLSYCDILTCLFTVLRPAQEYFTIIAGEGLQNLSLCSALRAFEQGGIFIVPHLLWHGTSVFPVSSEGPPQLVALTTRIGIQRTHSNPGPHEGIIFAMRRLNAGLMNSKIIH